MVTGRGYFPVSERGHRWLPESRPAVPSSGTHMCTARQRHCLSPRRHRRACAAWPCSRLRRRTSRDRRPSKAEPLSIRPLAGCHGQSSGWPHWIRSSTARGRQCGGFDLAYAPHLRPEGRRRLLALDAPRVSFLLALHYGGLQERSSLICATTVCTVCEHAQPKWAKNSSRITSAPAHEDSLRRRIVQWLSAYFLAPNSRSRRQSSIKPSSCFAPIPATPLRSFARSTRARFTSIMTRSSSPMARSCC